MAFVVPKECYINFRLSFDSEGNEKECIPLAFATYKEDNKAFEKRKETIDRWSNLTKEVRMEDENGNYIRDENNYVKCQTFEGKRPMETFENKLMTGFKIAKHVRRHGWNGGNVVWRIEDPRGFELEISSQNMAQIVLHCNMEQGEIMTPCLWSWEKVGGSRIVLLPRNSEPYRTALEDNRLHNTNISVKDINLLDEIELKNGATGTYYGCMEVLMSQYINHEYNHYRSRDQVNPVAKNEKGKWSVYGSGDGREIVSRKRYIIKLSDGMFYSVSNIKATRIIKKSRELVKQQVLVDAINTSLLEGNTITDSHEKREWVDRYSNSNIIVAGLMKKTLKDFKIRFVQTEDDFEPDTESGEGFKGISFFEDDDGNLIHVTERYMNKPDYYVYNLYQRYLENKLIFYKSTDRVIKLSDLGQHYYAAVEVNGTIYKIDDRY